MMWMHSSKIHVRLSKIHLRKEVFCMRRMGIHMRGETSRIAMNGIHVHEAFVCVILSKPHCMGHKYAFHRSIHVATASKCMEYMCMKHLCVFFLVVCIKVTVSAYACNIHNLWVHIHGQLRRA
jgi:hypothetical protein